MGKDVCTTFPLKFSEVFGQGSAAHVLRVRLFGPCRRAAIAAYLLFARCVAPTSDASFFLFFGCRARLADHNGCFSRIRACRGSTKTNVYGGLSAVCLGASACSVERFHSATWFCAGEGQEQQSIFGRGGRWLSLRCADLSSNLKAQGHTGGHRTAGSGFAPAAGLF